MARRRRPLARGAEARRRADGVDAGRCSSRPSIALYAERARGRRHERLRLARRRRPRRSRAAHAQGAARSCAAPISCSTTRSCSAAIIELARRAQRFYVGKRAGRHAISQDTIHRLMIRAARRGKRVVRLKGGDPFVFGRGGEEALALRAAGIPFEVVPGVSSVIAAPALAGIPVTHRGLASAFVVVSGHAESAFGPVLDSLAPGAATLVVLMGLSQRAAIAERLLARGWSTRTPAAIVSGRRAGGRGRMDRHDLASWARPSSTTGVARHDRDRRTSWRSLAVLAASSRRRRRWQHPSRDGAATDSEGNDHVSDGRHHHPGPRPAFVRDQADIDEFADTLGEVRERRDRPRPVARLPPGARHLRPAPGGRRPDAARQDPAGHARPAGSSTRSPTSPSSTRAASATSRRGRTSSSTS